MHGFIACDIFPACYFQDGQVSVLAGTGPDRNQVAYVKTVKQGDPNDPVCVFFDYRFSFASFTFKNTTKKMGNLHEVLSFE